MNSLNEMAFTKKNIKIASTGSFFSVYLFPIN